MPTCLPSTASCSIAAGRRVSSEAISILRFMRLGKALGDFRRRRGFARALQADHHDGDRRRRVEVDRLRARAQGLDQLVVHDLHDHLAGRDRLDDFDADGALLHLVGEGAGDVERDVGFDQRAPHLLQRRVDIGLRQRAAPGQAVEDCIQTLGKAVEHYYLLPLPAGGRGRVSEASEGEGASPRF